MTLGYYSLFIHNSQNAPLFTIQIWVETVFKSYRAKLENNMPGRGEFWCQFLKLNVGLLLGLFYKKTSQDVTEGFRKPPVFDPHEEFTGRSHHKMCVYSNT